MPSQNPVIILGGFLITSEAYENMKKIIEQISGRKVYIVEVSKVDWLLTNSVGGWSNIMNKLNQIKEIALQENSSGKVDLIGHSSGGVMLRLYLSKDIFNGKKYGGSDFTSNLITLGSPHQAKRATPLRKLVDEKFPENFFKNVNYVSIGGELEVKSSDSSLITKLFAKNSYKSISGEQTSIGDGLVPLSASLLNGSQKIILPKTSHSKIFGETWYGTNDRINEWYKQINWK